MPATQNDHFAAPSGRARSPFSRLTSTFSTKPRNLTGFAIVLDEPHRRYVPGESVKGRIEFAVHKITRITHIVLSLLGYVKVYKHPVLLGDGVPPDVVAPSTGRGKRGIEYHGNGQALLFEEEKVVCGDGRLTPGRYTFEFSIKFPSSALPSSLDFERGTIAYSLVSTLTRPTAISPVINCERKVYLDEAIDVGLVKIPKPDLITITPMFSRTRPKRRMKTRTDDPSDAKVTNPAESSVDCSTSQATVSQDGSSDRPGRRDSGATSLESSNASLERPQIVHSNSYHDDGSNGKAAVKGKTITARVEILRGGYLTGDLIPVRVMVQHTKFVKSLSGVIVTLYRIGRIDRHPLLPVTNSLRYATSEKKRDPDALVGIHGLSLSTPDKSHSFRMELAQSIAPMVVNPNTLQAEVKTGVQIPEGTFPTITGVPGRLITFTYHVEVVMDLHGKLSNIDGFLPRMNISDPGSVFGLPSNIGSTDYGTAGPGQNFLNTAQLRREKSIADSTFNIVIGTKDSAPRSTRKPADPWEEAFKSASHGVDHHNESAGPRIPQVSTPQAATPHRLTSQPHVPEAIAESFLQPSGAHDARRLSPLQYGPTPNAPSSAPSQTLIPPPPIEEPQDEKSRMRAAEERLLPSAPPVEYGPSPMAPSAPRLEDLDSPLSTEYNPHAIHFDSAFNNDQRPTSSLQHPPENEPGEGSSAAAATAAMMTSDATEDKQELERRRLLAQVSSPYDETDDAGIGSSGQHSHAPMAASLVPFFDESGEYVSPYPNGFLDTGDDADNAEHLPRYQK